MYRARRKFFLFALPAAACSLLAFAPAATACPGADLTYSAANAAAMNSAVVCLTNAERISRGLAPLARESRLDDAAGGHSRDMATKKYFSHTSKDGSELFERIERTGYPWRTVGENIAAGQRSARAVVLAWVRSKGHCVNMLRGQFKEIGVGVAPSSDQYGIYWTQDFASRTQGGEAGSAGDGCPFSQLVDSSNSTSDGSCLSTQPGRVTLASLRRVSRTRVRVGGRVSSNRCCVRVRFTVQRGKRRATTNKQLCGKKFTLKLRAPSGSGRIRVTATSLANGAKSWISLR